MNKICKYCNKEIIIENSKQFGAHLTNCKLNPKTLERYKNRKIKKKDFNIICKCGTEFKVNITTESFEKNNYKKFCSRKCANKRILNSEIKKKISNTVKRNNKIKRNLKIDISNDDKYGYIYYLSFNDVPFYVGKTFNLDKRLKKHLIVPKYVKTKRDKYIQDIIKSENKKNIKINVLSFISGEYIDYWEIYWINKFKECGIELVNSTDGGEGSLGRKFSEKIKNKISLKMKLISKQKRDNFYSSYKDVLINDYNNGLNFKQIGLKHEIDQRVVSKIIKNFK